MLVPSFQVDEAFMSVTDNVFTVPALYDQYLSSLLFQPYASDIAGRLTDLTGGRLLETAPSPWPGLRVYSYQDARG